MTLDIKDIVTAIAAAVWALLVVYITQRFAIRTHSTQRLWDRRLDAYSTIISEIDSASLSAKRIHIAFSEGNDEDKQTYYASPSYDRVGSQVFDHLENARKVMSSNSLILSPQFQRHFASLQQGIAETEESDLDPPERWEVIAGTLEHGVVQLRKVAEREVGSGESLTTHLPRIFRRKTR